MKNISGSRIKERRLELNMGQVELAAALIVDHKLIIDQSDISEIERGIRGVKDFELVAIAEILDVKIDWLVSGEID